MILHALTDYYIRLEQDPNSDIAPFGFSRQQISFEIVINDDGSLHNIQDIRQQEGKRQIPQSLVLPGGAAKSGSGINPGFLWGNTAYTLGYKNDDMKPERTQKSFEAFRDKHVALEQEINDNEFAIFCRFLERWNPADALENETLKEIATGFGIFRIRGRKRHIHSRAAVERWWCKQLAGDGESEIITGQCLITGEQGPLARLHEPKLKNVRGAQSSGALVVSFNFEATESYGLNSGYNAPVGSHTAFQYCTALNRLLRIGSRQRIQIGDATTVFWTEKSMVAERFMGQVFDTSATEDEQAASKLSAILKSIAAGQFPPEFGDPTTRFFILGLSPNAARISIRFWHSCTLSEVISKLKMHFADLNLNRSFASEPEFPALWQILRETARESKDIPPQLCGDLMRSVLSGLPYPDALPVAILRRIRADRHIGYVRVAVLKAWLVRKARFNINPLNKEIEMALDPTRTEPAYQIGRLFAVLEKAQEDAHKITINNTIKDRFFAAASATPASVFPQLIRLSQHHLGKLEKGHRISHERRIQEIVGMFDEFPSHLNLQNQGLFTIGYYHQRQDLFKKKTNSDTSETQPEKE